MSGFKFSRQRLHAGFSRNGLAKTVRAKTPSQLTAKALRKAAREEARREARRQRLGGAPQESEGESCDPSEFLGGTPHHGETDE